jgi:hypothetical protein
VLGVAWRVGIGEDPGGDPFLVAVATLNLLSAHAEPQPLVVIADDLHWLDAPSRDAIAFVARRIDSDPIVVLAAWREGYEDQVGELGVTEHALTRLGDEEAAAILDARAPGLSPGLRAGVLTQAAGNPLALVELPVAAGAGDDAALPLNARLDRAFAARLGDLPEDTRVVLLVAAADQSIAVSEILAGGEVMLGRPAG